MASPAQKKQPTEQKNNQQFIAGKAETWSDNDGISYVRFLPETEIGYDDMVQIFLIGGGGSAIKDRKLVVLCDMRYLSMITREALDFPISPTVLERVAAMAVVADRFETRSLSHHYICGFKPPVPIRVFSNFDLARTWLHSLLHDGTVE